MFVIPWAWAGQVDHHDVSLDSVLVSTSAAAIVRFGPVVSAPVAIPIPSAKGKDCGTYSYGVTEATVERVLLDPSAGPSLSPGEKLTIWPADTASLIWLSTLACDTGASESPIFDRFPGITPVPGGTAIALIRWTPPYGWVEATSGSWLAVGRAGEVVRSKAIHPVPDPKAEILCRADADCTRATLFCGACGVCPEPPGPPQHALTVRQFFEVCAASRALPPGVTAPDRPEPNCAPCPAPSGRPLPGPPVCRAMRCVEPSP